VLRVEILERSSADLHGQLPFLQISLHCNAKIYGGNIKSEYHAIREDVRGMTSCLVFSENVRNSALNRIFVAFGASLFCFCSRRESNLEVLS